MQVKKQIAIIGGGPAALMLACQLNPEKFNICIYEKNTALGRKFLVAGKGGFNLTHSEPVEELIKRYSPQSFLEKSVLNFTNTDLRNWLKEKGIETYIGTSKRIFPTEGIKPIEVLNVFEKELKKKNVAVYTQHNFLGWNENKDLLFETKTGNKSLKADIIVFALGGGSWKVTGSDGGWLKLFTEKGIECAPFVSSNCAYKVDWKNSDKIPDGEALKNCSFSCNGITKKGEAVITKSGIEGGAVYALSKEIRESLEVEKKAILYIDFKPDIELPQLVQLLNNKEKTTVKEFLFTSLKLSVAKITLLKNITTREEYLNPVVMARLIKAFPIVITDLAQIDEAISTVGGINLNEVNENFELKKLFHHFCIGEMLDWDAPTGGYLLQACFSMGCFLAKHLNSQ